MKPQLSEQRARVATRELLSFRGWDLRPVSAGGQLFEESEYRQYGPLFDIFRGQSKTGPGLGKPDFLLVESAESLKPLIVIDTKARAADLSKSIRDTHHYANAIHESGQDALAVAVAGAEREICEVRVQRRVADHWRDLTLHRKAIDWIPSPQQTVKILSTAGATEVAPERPPEKVLSDQANRLNEILRECNIKDEFRPIYAATFMLALWLGEVSPQPELVLEQINANAGKALQTAGKADLSNSLRVDSENEELALRAWQIIDILKKLNIRSFLHEHDYLGQLYETFFRYTGGNTIGQYFTPRHIVDFMCDVVQVTPKDIVFDPACGTGGFLVGALNRMIRAEHLTYHEAIERVKKNIYGIESEPTTAALCVTNMILRGDGKSGVIRGNSFKVLDYPSKPVDIALLNPPFPHKKKTQKPASAFVDRALLSARNRGLVAAIVPYSLLANLKDWHRQLLKKNRLLFVATLPADLFNPYSNYDTAIIVIEKGIPHDDSRVFFCRIDDDGYKKKKAMRIPHGRSSQLGPALEAFDQKKEIPEFTAYKPLTEKSKEWAPETFIESAPHDDTSFVFGLEEFTRQHAAFYVQYGHRLLGNDASYGIEGANRVFVNDSDISFAGVTQGRFRIPDYFRVMLGGKDEIEDLDEGNDPFVSTSERDNGVAEWKKANYLYPARSITVATDGSAYSSFVQEFPFYAFYKVAILRPKHAGEVPVDALYYVSYLISREVWRFVRARKFGKARIEATELYAPTKDGKPDFAKMAEIVRGCAAYPVIESFRTAYRRHVDERFAEFAAEWKTGRRVTSSVSRMAEHPAYEKIIRMGYAVVPLILQELAREPDHWFVALNKITGENPVNGDARGKIAEMADAWIRWGENKGYVTTD
jgi:type I restriction enzyme M protein